MYKTPEEITQVDERRAAMGELVDQGFSIYNIGDNVWRIHHVNSRGFSGGVSFAYGEESMGSPFKTLPSHQEIILLDYPEYPLSPRKGVKGKEKLLLAFLQIGKILNSSQIVIPSKIDDQDIPAYLELILISEGFVEMGDNMLLQRKNHM